MDFDKILLDFKRSTVQFNVNASSIHVQTCFWCVWCSQNDKDKGNFTKLLDVMKSSRNGKAIGVFSKDDFPGEFCKSWQDAMSAHKFETADIGASIAFIMAAKEESELVVIRKACIVSVDVFGKYLKEHILEIIDAEKVSRDSLIFLTFLSNKIEKEYNFCN